MNEITNSINIKVCDACKKSFDDFKILIGVYYQDMEDGVVVGDKKKTLLCPTCFMKLDKSPTGMGVISEDGIKPLGVNLK